MKFSVVIPLYNKEKSVGRAIESVLAQTHTDFELIVVDDGSTDGGAAVAETYKDERLRVIRQSNAGVSAARNAGIAAAAGEFVAFLDADDVWLPGYLALMRELISRFPAAGVYASAYESIGAGGVSACYAGGTEFENERYALIGDYFAASIHRCLLTASSVVVRKKVFSEAGGFNTALSRGEDRDMWRRAALLYPVAFANEIGARIYLDAENRACSRQAKLTESTAFFAEEVLARAKAEGTVNPSYEEYMIKVIIIKAQFLVADGRCAEARRLLRKYRYTKRNRKALVRTYLLSFAPASWRRKGAFSR